MKTQHDPILLALAATTLAFAALADQYYLFLLIMGALTVIVGVGLNVLMGLTGLVSFGHVGFYAIGAYATAALSTKLGLGFWWTLPVSMLVTGVLGALLGLVALRVKGPYLAMVTIAFGFVVEFTAVEWEHVTGGQNGLMNIPYPALGGWSIGERGVAVAAFDREVPTLAESGLKDFNMPTWQGIFGPKDLPKAIVVRYNQALLKALANPEVRKKMAEFGSEPVGDTPEHFAGFLAQDRKMWADVIKTARITLQ